MGYNSNGPEFHKIPNEMILFIREEIDEELEDKLMDIEQTNSYFLIPFVGELNYGFAMIVKSDKHACANFARGRYFLVNKDHKLFAYYHDLMGKDLGLSVALLLFLKSEEVFMKEERERLRIRQPQGQSFHINRDLHIELPQDPLPFPMPKLPEGASRIHPRDLNISENLAQQTRRMHPTIPTI